VFLQRWARDHEIRLKVFSPSRAVVDELEPSDAAVLFSYTTHPLELAPAIQPGPFQPWVMTQTYTGQPAFGLSACSRVTGNSDVIGVSPRSCLLTTRWNPISLAGGRLHLLDVAFIQNRVRFRYKPWRLAEARS
jgi:hypothetical protein